ncbi:forkhead box protein D3-like [Anolis carolinensis]|uniref:forkhead box protein D3-like n=1 Tax=Anolis carolinensis TaxID=28377 RepID=UPI002F2B26F7
MDGAKRPGGGASFTIDYLLCDKDKTAENAMVAANVAETVPGPDPEKPNQSYIALISTAILSSPEKKLLLSDIYQWIMDKYPYFKNKEKSWRNSVRHNLSLNECFVKAGRSENGKGHFWAIHPANLEDFSKGDYHRRRARRRIRRMAVNLGYFPPCALLGLGCCPPVRLGLCCPPYGTPIAATALRPPYCPPAFPPLLLPSWPQPHATL